jgi:hypothetical protein
MIGDPNRIGKGEVTFRVKRELNPNLSNLQFDYRTICKLNSNKIKNKSIKFIINHTRYLINTPNLITLSLTFLMIGDPNRIGKGEVTFRVKKLFTYHLAA